MRFSIFKSNNRIFSIIKAAVVLSLITAVSFAFPWESSASTSSTAALPEATLKIIVRTTEPLSDPPYIFRVTTQDEGDGQLSAFRIVLGKRERATVDIPSSESNNLQVWESSATLKLYYGDYRIELPSDVRWRHGDIETCYNKVYEAAADKSQLEHPDQKGYPSPYNVLVTPHDAFSAYYNNRISLRTSAENKDVECVINLVRINERWLSYFEVSEGTTSK